MNDISNVKFNFKDFDISEIQTIQSHGHISICASLLKNTHFNRGCSYTLHHVFREISFTGKTREKLYLFRAKLLLIQIKHFKIVFKCNLSRRNSHFFVIMTFEVKIFACYFFQQLLLETAKIKLEQFKRRHVSLNKQLISNKLEIDICAITGNGVHEIIFYSVLHLVICRHICLSYPPVAKFGKKKPI